MAPEMIMACTKTVAVQMRGRADLKRCEELNALNVRVVEDTWFLSWAPELMMRGTGWAWGGWNDEVTLFF